MDLPEARTSIVDLVDYSLTKSPEDYQSIIHLIRNLVQDKKIAFVSGNFNVIHPGHFRLLNFAAECADFLIVGVNDDDQNQAILVPFDLRLESVRGISSPFTVST